MNLDELAGPHTEWCHSVGHGDCCGAECDCGRDDRRQAIAAALAAAGAIRERVLAVIHEWEERGTPMGYYATRRLREEIGAE